MSLPWHHGGKFEIENFASLGHCAVEMAVEKGRLLSMMQQSARNGTLLSSCEPEVRELMHQIDVLISGKQAEWAAQWAGLETQLREKERELAAVRHTLWQKDTELEQLHQQRVISSAQKKVSYDATPRNDSHVQHLRTELERMTEKYEQLKARRHKHSSTQATSLMTQSVSVRKCSEEIHTLRQEKQTLEDICVQVERDKSVLEGKLKLLQSEITALQEKSSGLESEVKFCRSQLDQKDSLVAAIEQSSTVRAKQLEAQLKRTQELAESRDLAQQKLRGECEKWERAAETALAETATIRAQLTQSQAAAKQMKGRCAKLQLHVKKVEDQLMVTGTQLSQREQGMKLLQESSQRKDDLIRSLGGRQGQQPELSRLKQELDRAQSQLQSHIQQERNLKEEVTTLRQRNAANRQEISGLTAECASKDKRLAEELANLAYKHATKLKELHSQLSKMGQEKTLAREKKEAECAGSEMQVRLLEDRLRTLEKTVDSTVQGTVSDTRKAPTLKSAAPLAHQTEQRASLPAPATIPTREIHSLPQSTLSRSTHNVAQPTQPPTTTSRIIEKFLTDTNEMSHNTRSSSHELETVQKAGHTKPSSKHTSLLTEGFVPLQPVSHTNIDEDNISVRSRSYEGDGAGEVDGGHRRGDEGERGGGDGCGSKLEDMFSKTLDSIVDRHFQQLDTSLRNLMSKET